MAWSSNRFCDFGPALNNPSRGQQMSRNKGPPPAINPSVVNNNSNTIFKLESLKAGTTTVSITVKPALSGRSKRRPKMVFKADYRLMQVKNILQYFRRSLSYHLSLISLFCLFLFGRLRQVSLYHAKAFLTVLTNCHISYPALLILRSSICALALGS